MGVEAQTEGGAAGGSFQVGGNGALSAVPPGALPLLLRLPSLWTCIYPAGGTTWRHHHPNSTPPLPLQYPEIKPFLSLRVH